MDDEVIQATQLYRPRLDEASLRRAIEKARQTAEPSFVILERLETVAFPLASDPIALQEWERGRIFNDRLEVSWERVGGSYQVWITADGGDVIPEEDWGDPGAFDWVMDRRSVYLWGEGDPQIGTKMEYRPIGKPSGPEDRAQALLNAYRDPDTYEMRHYRYVGMRRGR